MIRSAGLYTTRWLHSSTLLTKINTIVILSTSAATLSMLVVTATGITTIFAQQNYNLFNAQLAQLYPHNVFNAKLAGSNEVPPVSTAASGTATFQLLPAAGHEQVLSFQLSLKNINGVTGAHIHNGKQGENGPVVADLFNPSGPTGAINGKLAAGTLTSSKLTGSLHNKELSALVNMIRSGEAYVNIHTTQNQNGEIRGQIS